MSKLLHASVLLAILWTAGLAAAGAEELHRIRIAGRKSATVTTGRVLLGSISDIFAPSAADDEAVIALQKIDLGPSPAPGSSLNMSADEVLGKLRAAGVNFQEVGYVFPRVVTVERAGQTISHEEVRQAIERYLAQSGRDVTLQEVDYSPAVKVPPGAVALNVAEMGQAQGGKSSFVLHAAGEGGQETVRFKVTARLEEWRQVPVARRAVTRGRIVTEEDLMMARLNVATLPRDVALEPQDVIGLETSNDIGYGEAFHGRKLVVPPLITAGSRVTMIYKAALFEATALGIALESGKQDQQIKVRNISSKRVVTGRVVDAGIVRVGP